MQACERARAAVAGGQGARGLVPLTRFLASYPTEATCIQVLAEQLHRLGLYRLSALTLRQHALVCLGQGGAGAPFWHGLKAALSASSLPAAVQQGEPEVLEQVADALQQGQCEEALAALTPVLLASPTVPPLRLSELDTLLKFRLHDKALEQLPQLFALDPESLDVHEKAYHVYVATNRQALADEQMLNVLRLCAQRQDVKRARPFLAELLQTQPDHPEAAQLQAALSAADGGESEQGDELSEDAVLNADELEIEDLEPLEEFPEVQGAEAAQALGEVPQAQDTYQEASSGEWAEPAPSEPPVETQDGAAQGEWPGEPAPAASPGWSGVSSEPFQAQEVAAVEVAPGLEEEVASAPIADVEAPAPGVDFPWSGAPGQAAERDAQEAGSEEAGSDAQGQEERPGEEPLGAASFREAGEMEAEPAHAAEASLDITEEGGMGEVSVDEEPPAADASHLAADEVPVEVEVGAGEDAQAPSLADDEALAEEASSPMTPASSALDDVHLSSPSEASAAGLSALDSAPTEEAPVAEEAPAAEEDTAAEECEEAIQLMGQGLLEEAREVLEVVRIAFPGHRRAGQLLEELDIREQAAASAGEVPEESTQLTATVDAADGALVPPDDVSAKE
jgi:pilus assembly protein FimV